METDFLSVCSHQNLILFGGHTCILILICMTDRKAHSFQEVTSFFNCLVMTKVLCTTLIYSDHMFCINMGNIRKYIALAYYSRIFILKFPVLAIRGQIKDHKHSQVLQFSGYFSSHVTSYQRKKSGSKQSF